MNHASAIAIGFLAASVIAAAGFRARALSGPGSFAAVVVGTAVFGLGGWRWAAVMIAFFALSSALSRIGHGRKSSAESVVEKGSQRDAVQVLANGGVAALMAVFHGISPESSLAFPAFLGAMAAATADTWSTEIGSLSRSTPRSILTGKPVPAGSSGGVTQLGFAGALAGALLIGIVGGAANTSAFALILTGVLAGFSGSVVDSLLGASVQQINQCPVCLVMTERAIHDCGAHTTPVLGVRGVDNDVVNFITTLFGALIAALFFWLAG